MNCEYQRSSLGKPLPKHATERVTEETQISSRTSTKLIQRAGDSDGGQRAEDSDEGQKCCGQMWFPSLKDISVNWMESDWKRKMGALRCVNPLILTAAQPFSKYEQEQYGLVHTCASVRWHTRIWRGSVLISDVGQRKNSVSFVRSLHYGSVLFSTVLITGFFLCYIQYVFPV